MPEEEKPEPPPEAPPRKKRARPAVAGDVSEAKPEDGKPAKKPSLLQSHRQRWRSKPAAKPAAEPPAALAIEGPREEGGPAKDVTPKADVMALEIFSDEDKEKSEPSDVAVVSKPSEKVTLRAKAAEAVPESPPSGVITLTNQNFMKPFSNDPMCSKCGFKVDPCKPGVRLVAKTPPTFQCSGCNSKTTMLSRMFGVWPLPEFKQLEPHVQQEFWATAASTKEALQRTVENIVLSRVVERELVSDLGTFLPLDQYRTQYGWSEDLLKAVEEKAPCEDHAILGKTYQVKLHSCGYKKHRDMVREMMCKLLEKGNSMTASGSSGPAKPLAGKVAEKDEDDEESNDASGDTDKSSAGNSTDDSNGSSNESDKGRKKSKKSKQKKNKKDKKDKKKDKKDKKSAKKNKKEKQRKAEAERRQRDAERKERARVQKVKRDASKVVAKLSSEILTLQQTLTTLGDKSSAVPMPLQKKFKDDYALVKALYDEACLKMKAKDPLDLTFTVADVAPVLKTALHSASCIISMVATMDNLSLT